MRKGWIRTGRKDEDERMREGYGETLNPKILR